jgi:hypothetical protein
MKSPGLNQKKILESLEENPKEGHKQEEESTRNHMLKSQRKKN